MLSWFCLAILEYCSAVWCLAADTHLELLNRAVSGAQFLTGVCLSQIECDIAHCQSVAVLCMLYKIRCNQVHPLKGHARYKTGKSHVLLLMQINYTNIVWNNVPSFMKIVSVVFELCKKICA